MDLSLRGRNMPASPIRRLAGLAERAVARGIRIYRLNIGQPDIPTPVEMLDAIRSYSDPVLAYGPSGGLPETRAAMADYLDNLGTPMDPDQVLVTDGGSEAILFTLAVLCDPQDEVIVFEPFYTNYAGFAHMTSVKLVPIRTSVEDGYRPPPAREIESAITGRTRAILYCSPSNPTGTTLRRDEVRTLVDIAKKRDVFLVADEVYREFTYDGVEHVSVLDVAAEAGALDRVVLVDSISKRFSACGARIGFMASHNGDVVGAGLRFGQSRLCPPTIDQFAAIAGYQVVHRTVPPMVEEFRRRRNLVVDALGSIPGVVCGRPEGAFYVMPRIPVEDANEFAAFLLTDFQHQGRTVLFAPGDGFYVTPRQGRDEIRIAYVLNERDLEVAMDLLGRGIEAYNGRKHS